MILFCGDPHGEFRHIIDAVKRLQPAALVVLGDLQAQRPLHEELAPILDETDVWFIHGNHDTDSDADHDHLFESGLADRNLHGRVVDVAGVRIAGLGGVFREKVWGPPAVWRHETRGSFLASCPRQDRWRGGLPRKHRSTIFPADYAALIDQRADVLVTHEAPSCHPHGFSVIDDLARSLQVSHAFHGHHHLGYEAKLDGVAVTGVGLRGISTLTASASCSLEPNQDRRLL